MSDLSHQPCPTSDWLEQYRREMQELKRQHEARRSYSDWDPENRVTERKPSANWRGMLGD